MTQFSKILITVALCTLTSCKALPALQDIGFAAGGAAVGSIAGPGGAAGGAAAGVAASEIITAYNDDDPPKQGSYIIPTPPTPSVPGFLDSLKSLIHAAGWWYLVIFIAIPLLTRKGRSWFTNFMMLHDTATKKHVDEYSERLNKLEGMISSLTPKENK